MAIFKAGDIVRVPFPYTDRPVTQRRPALVVSDGALGSGLLLWVLMITSIENRPWPGDIAIPVSLELTGLAAPSIVRTLKLATIEAGTAETIGRLDDTTLAAVRTQLTRALGLSSVS
ncbi:MAG: growth inhibitor PemK [Devosia sp.]|nr:growth inhibitor PemK [Devosia sp.]